MSTTSRAADRPSPTARASSNASRAAWCSRRTVASSPRTRASAASRARDPRSRATISKEAISSAASSSLPSWTSAATYCTGQPRSPGSCVGPLPRLNSSADRATTSSGWSRQEATCTAAFSQTANVAGSPSAATMPRASSRWPSASPHAPRPAATVTATVCRKPWTHNCSESSASERVCSAMVRALSQLPSLYSTSARAPMATRRLGARSPPELTLSARRSARAPARSSTAARSTPRAQS